MIASVSTSHQLIGKIMNKAKTNKQRQEPKPDDVIKLNKEAWERLQSLIKLPPEPTPALKELMRL